MTRTPQINLYATDTHPCSYLEGQDANTIFVDPHFPVTAELYGQLSTRGFRRSGEHIYRPHCAHCQACIPIRVSVDKFHPNRQQKRVWAHNQDLSVEVSNEINSGEYYRLYERYINARHADGDMHPATPEQFENFLAKPFIAKPSSDQLLPDETAQITLYLEFREKHVLKAIAVTDVLPVGLSAVYTFFEPVDKVRSLGVFAVLFQIELARKLGLSHLYLGYWIKNSPKMNYKSRYKPYELYQNGVWQPS